MLVGGGSGGGETRLIIAGFVGVETVEMRIEWEGGGGSGGGGGGDGVGDGRRRGRLEECERHLAELRGTL
jgi:hypothetical protein